MRLSYLVIAVIFITSINFSFSQNLEVLKSKNGFRELKLGDKADNYPELIKKDSSNLSYFGVWQEYDYIVHPESDLYKNIGESEVYRILVKTYEGLIYKIFISVESNYEVIDLLKTEFGEATWINKTSDTNLVWDYVWRANNIICRLFNDSVSLKDETKPFRLYYIDENIKDLD